MRNQKTRELVLCALFTALTAVGAFIKIPVPVVPFTLQFLFTMLAGLLLGGRLGAISVGAYAVLGLLGLPIFTEGGGFWYLLKPSFGYILGFIVGKQNLTVQIYVPAASGVFAVGSYTVECNITSR